MKTLVSWESNLPIAVGAVVQDLTADGLVWVKVVDISLEEGLVKLSGLLPIPWQAWHDPKDIGAYFRNSAENSLAGGRCSSTGLAGQARQELDKFCSTEAAPGWLPPPGGMFTFSGGHADPRTALSVTGPELDAILAGLHLLAREVEAGNVKFSDDDAIGYIWTDSGDHEGLAPDALLELAGRLNRG